MVNRQHASEACKIKNWEIEQHNKDLSPDVLHAAGTCMACTARWAGSTVYISILVTP